MVTRNSNSNTQKAVLGNCPESQAILGYLLKSRPALLTHQTMSQKNKIRQNIKQYEARTLNGMQKFLSEWKFLHTLCVKTASTTFVK